MNAAIMLLVRHERGIHAIEKRAGPVSAVTGARWRPCRTIDTNPRRYRDAGPGGGWDHDAPGPRGTGGGRPAAYPCERW